MQTESPEIILIKPRPRLTGVFYWIVLLVAVDAGFELYRVIQYCINWQFMLTLITPFQFWLMANISFIVFAASLPVLIGLFTRSDWAPVWCLRFLTGHFVDRDCSDDCLFRRSSRLDQLGEPGRPGFHDDHSHCIPIHG